jgi:hypothetical protein
MKHTRMHRTTCKEVKLHNSVAKSSYSPKKWMESKEYRMTSILFDGVNPGGTKKAIHALAAH